MELKDILVITLGVCGWIWAIIQFIITRKNQKKDKALEKRFDVYVSFMDKVDEMNQNMRSDPQMMYGISSDLLAKIFNGEGPQALLEYNDRLIEFSRRLVQSMLITNQELNKLKLVCSDSLLVKIDQYKSHTNGIVEEFQKIMNNISPNKDIDIAKKEMITLGHSDRFQLMQVLWKEIEKMMREEIGYYKQS